MKAFALLAHDPTTGVATQVVGVLAVDAASHAVAWVPHQPASTSWRTRLDSAAELPLPVDTWIADADGVTWDVAETDLNLGSDLQSAAEIALDRIAEVWAEAG